MGNVEGFGHGQVEEVAMSPCFANWPRRQRLWVSFGEMKVTGSMLNNP